MMHMHIAEKCLCICWTQMVASDTQQSFATLPCCCWHRPCCTQHHLSIAYIMRIPALHVFSVWWLKMLYALWAQLNPQMLTVQTTHCPNLIICCSFLCADKRF